MDFLYGEHHDLIRLVLCPLSCHAGHGLRVNIMAASSNFQRLDRCDHLYQQYHTIRYMTGMTLRLKLTRNLVDQARK